MVKNAKFHAIAISLIIAVILIIYAFIGPKPSQPGAVGNTQQTNRYLRIVNATWGKNCDEYIDLAIKSRNDAPLQKDASGNIVPQKPLARVQIDNVLPVIKTICDGKPSCLVGANTQVLGIDPLEACYKKLNVTYRCFDIDPMSIKEVDQGQTLALDCKPLPTDAAAPAATHP